MVAQHDNFLEEYFGLFHFNFTEILPEKLLATQ